MKKRSTEDTSGSKAGLYTEEETGWVCKMCSWCRLLRVEDK